MERNFIITLTTIPSRYESLLQCLDSLIKQNYSNYEIHLNIPINTKFEGKYTKDITINNDKLKIFYVNDLGPITKIYYTLKRVNNLEQFIITVDDDFTYDCNMLQLYNTQVSKLSNFAIGFAGIYPINNSEQFFIGGSIPAKEPTFVGVLEGYKSVCYKRKFFDNDFFEQILQKNMIWNNDIHTQWMDDIVISGYLGYKNINKVCIPQPPNKNSFPLCKDLYNKPSGCHNYRNIYGNISAIKNYYRSRLGKYIKK